MVRRPPWWDLDGQDAYELLDVAVDATLKEITQAYHRQMKVWHTDVSDHATAEQKSRYLNKAYEVLVHHRAAYDEHRHRPKSPSGDESGEQHHPWHDVAADSWQDTPEDPWENAETIAPDPPTPSQRDTPRPAPPQRPRPEHVPYTYRTRSTATGTWGSLIVAVGVLTLLGVIWGVNAHHGAPEETSPSPIAVPERLNGTWQGTIKDPPRKIEITLTFTENAETGKVHYADGKCDGDVDLSETATDRMSLRLDLPRPDGDCKTGDAEISERSDGRLAFSYQQDTLPLEKGMLFTGILARRR